MDLQSVLKSIEENNIKYIRMELSDQYGVARCKIVPSRHFERKAKTGLNYIQASWMALDPEGGIIDGTGYLEELNIGDAVCFPDYNTFAVLPWVENTARVLLNATYKGKTVGGFPREVAIKQCDRLKEMGFSLLAAHEHEFMLQNVDTKEAVFDTYQYSATFRSTFNLPFFEQIERDLLVAGVDLEFIETEYNPGQVELPYRPAFGIRAADNAHTYKTAIKEIARQHNYLASFMTKPDPAGDVGNGAHLNHSLWDAEGKLSLFYDEKSPTGLSDIAQHWMAGILEHGPAITLLHAPTVNCLRRYKPDSWAPTTITWGHDNRTCLLRAKVTDQNGTYIENRLPGSGGSPYLSLAGMIIAGIDGIQRQLPLPDPVDGSAYQDRNSSSPRFSYVPNNMKDAVDAFLKDKVVTEALGSDFVKGFVAAKMHEMKCEQEAKEKGDLKWEEKYYSYL